jgi:hypothetical protein
VQPIFVRFFPAESDFRANIFRAVAYKNSARFFSRAKNERKVNPAKMNDDKIGF